MTRPALITLLTDFGLEDPYVGVMKAVLLEHCPSATLIDLTHGIAPGDRMGAGFWLERVVPWFPAGTVHLVVVDPGVGSERAALVVAARGQYFVGPDNGMFTSLALSDADAELWAIDSAALGLSVPSRTFHGRDLFGPVAARLAAGSLSVAEVGPRVYACCPSVVPRPRAIGAGWLGQIVVIDRFGNAITNLELPTGGESFQVRIADRILPIVQTYADCAVAELFALVGSFGTLEIAQRDGHAARALGALVGGPVELCRAAP